MTIRLGVDIGGTGIKAAPVDLERGALVGDRQYVATPRPATPAAVAITDADLVHGVDTDGPVGLGFPGVVKQGVTATAANLHPDWIGANAEILFSHQLGGGRWPWSTMPTPPGSPRWVSAPVRVNPVWR